MQKENNVKETNMNDCNESSQTTISQKIESRQQMICALLSNPAWIDKHCKQSANELASAAVDCANAVIVELEMDYNRL
jgi:hypothetical protein